MLEGAVELDDAYLGAGSGLVGRGTDKQPFIAAVGCGRGAGCRLRAVPDCSGASYQEFAEWHLSKGARVRADDWNGIRGGLANWPSVDQRKFDAGDAERCLPAVHHVISNFKAYVLGTYHGVTPRCLQGYMDEWCWRYGHRGMSHKFDLLVADVCRGGKHFKRDMGAVFAVQEKIGRKEGLRRRRKPVEREVAWPKAA